MDVRNKDSIRHLFNNQKILPLISQRTFSCYYLLTRIEIYMNQVQKFTMLTLFSSDLRAATANLLWNRSI